MGVKNSMNTFFAAMQGQNSSGYGGRLVNTPMGPFRWDDNFNMWINVNNGMALSNISFQDEFAIMMNYDTLSGSSNDLNLNITTVPWSRNDYTMNVVSFSPATVSITANVLAGSTVASNVLTISGNTLPAYLKAGAVTGPSYVNNGDQINDFLLTYRRNGGVIQPSGSNYTLYLNNIDSAGNMPVFPPGQSFAASNTIQLFAQAQDWFIGSATYGIQLYNPQNGNTYVSDIWYIGMNVPARTQTGINGSVAFGDVNGGFTAGYDLGPTYGFLGYTYYVSLFTQTMTRAPAGGISEILFSGNNVPVKIRAITTGVRGTPLAKIIGSTTGSNTGNEIYIDLTSGVSVGPYVNASGVTKTGYLWVGLATNGVSGATGSGQVWLYNDTVGATISTGLTYSYFIRGGT